MGFFLWNSKKFFLGKPNSRHDAADGEEDAEFLNIIHKVRVEPRKKYSEPITETQVQLKTYDSKRTGQGISLNGKVPFEILPEKPHITQVLYVLLFTEEFQMEPPAHNAILLNTSPEGVLDQMI